MNSSLYKNIRKSITSLDYSSKDFFQVAKLIYDYQKEHNQIFRSYINYLNCLDKEIKSIEDFIFLPIEHFKRHKVVSGNWQEEKIFKSSGTSLSVRSQHYVRDLNWYLDGCVYAFESAFDNLNGSIVIGLLPNYLEQGNSSLVAMVDHFIKKTNHSNSGFYLDEIDALPNLLVELKSLDIPVYVIGVSYALLDLATKYTGDFSHVKFIETGGMKGKRKEMTKDEVHDVLNHGFKTSHIYSEYGMTELFSQAYMLTDKVFFPASTLQILVNEVNDPFKYIQNKTGQLNVIDLMNIDTCSFIQTSDLAKRYSNGSFEVLGRIDYSDIRGCNLMID